MCKYFEATVLNWLIWEQQVKFILLKKPRTHLHIIGDKILIYNSFSNLTQPHYCKAVHHWNWWIFIQCNQKDRNTTTGRDTCNASNQTFLADSKLWFKHYVVCPQQKQSVTLRETIWTYLRFSIDLLIMQQDLGPMKFQGGYATTKIETSKMSYHSSWLVKLYSRQTILSSIKCIFIFAFNTVSNLRIDSFHFWTVSSGMSSLRTSANYFRKVRRGNHLLTLQNCQQ